LALGFKQKNAFTKEGILSAKLGSCGNQIGGGGGGGGGVQPLPLALLLELPPPAQQWLLELLPPVLQPDDALPEDALLFLFLPRLEPPLPPDTNSISSKVKILMTLYTPKKVTKYEA
jgi:hypothetical protein